MLAQVKKRIKNSEILAVSQRIAQNKIPSYKYRPLTDTEIAELIQNGNTCDDWTRIQADLQFTTTQIRNTTFCGKVYLPKFFGNLMAPGGVSVPAGIFNSSINNSIIENCHLFNVSTLSNTIVSHSALLRNVGSVIGSGKTHFGVGRKLNIGDETGNRTLLAFPEIDLSIATAVVMNKEDIDFQNEYTELIEEYRENSLSPFTFIDQEVIISNTTNIRNAWIGRNARIDGAIRIKNSVILSSMEQPSAVYDGAIIENATLQWGCEVCSLALVDHSILLEESSASKQVKITHSVIGSNTHPESGEITSSLIGPFVGMHHQSLLIAALWPDGCGNVGYGANVGSNHTGRLPDQEIYPGQGMFFGLSTSIKFPANYSKSPWSLIATGVTTLPQRLKFPFSLITESQGSTPQHLLHLNELQPGWVFRYNAFALARNEMKFSKRDKSRRNKAPYTYITKETAQMVLAAWHRLNTIVQVKEYYTEENIEGLGKNYLTESKRQQALIAYADYLEMYALRRIISKLETKEELLASEKPTVKKLFNNDIMRDIARIVTFPASTIQLLKRYRKVERAWTDAIRESIQKDFDRGVKVFDDYTDIHSPDEPSLQFIQDTFDNNRKRANNLIALAKN
ncbi:MAG: DUF4954 family protein [Fibrobacterales bacterium]